MRFERTQRDKRAPKHIPPESAEGGGVAHPNIPTASASDSATRHGLLRPPHSRRRTATAASSAIPAANPVPPSDPGATGGPPPPAHGASLCGAQDVPLSPPGLAAAAAASGSKHPSPPAATSS